MSDVADIVKSAIIESELYSDESGRPIVFYHSYDGEDDLESEMIWLSTNEEFSKEFGENTDAYYLKTGRIYVTEEDGILRDENNVEIMFESEPAEIGFFDSISDDEQIWFEDNFDCVMDPDGVFTIVFDRDMLIPVDV